MSQSRRGPVQPTARVRRPKVAGRMSRSTDEDTSKGGVAPVSEGDADLQDDAVPGDRESSAVPASREGGAAPESPAVALKKDADSATPAAAETSAADSPKAAKPTKAKPAKAKTKIGEAPLLGRRLLAIGLVLTVLFTGLAVTAWLTKPAPAQIPRDSANVAFSDEELTGQVLARAKEAIEAISSYGYETLDADFDRARSFLSDEMKNEYEKVVGPIREGATQRQLDVNAVAEHVGLKSLTPERAEVVALVTVTQTFAGTGDEVYRGPVRLVMEPIDGEWKVTEIA
jgi:Mce-associated membrane protein